MYNYCVQLDMRNRLEKSNVTPQMSLVDLVPVWPNTLPSHLRVLVWPRPLTCQSVTSVVVFRSGFMCVCVLRL